MKQKFYFHTERVKRPPKWFSDNGADSFLDDLDSSADKIILRQRRCVRAESDGMPPFRRLSGADSQDWAPEIWKKIGGAVTRDRSRSIELIQGFTLESLNRSPAKSITDSPQTPTPPRPSRLTLPVYNPSTPNNDNSPLPNSDASPLTPSGNRSHRRANSDNVRSELVVDNSQHKESFGQIAGWTSLSSWSEISSDENLNLSEEVVNLSYELNKKYFLQFILKDEEARKVFMQFLKKRHCAENLKFWVAVERYTKLQTDEARLSKAKEIFEKYLDEGAPFEINVPGAVRSDVRTKMDNPQVDTFLCAQKSIFLLMVEGAFEYFVTSERYKAFQRSRTDNSGPTSEGEDQEKEKEKAPQTKDKKEKNKDKEKEKKGKSGKEEAEGEKRKKRAETLPARPGRTQGEKEKKCTIS